MTQVKKLDFSGTTIYCGVDVHKKSWRVNIQDSEFELEDFTQNPDAVLLHKHLTRYYPGAIPGLTIRLAMKQALVALVCSGLYPSRVVNAGW